MDNFKNPNRNPQIAISVDMLDTGIDVPEILNLVFFKPVKSKTKFWQMIGRGTRLCSNLLGDGLNKKEFYIFDFGMNFTYFGLTPEGMPSSKTTSLQERLFLKRVGLIKILKDGEFKKELVSIVKAQVDNLDLGDYRLKKHRFIIEELQTLDLNIITDKVYEDIKIISDYIEDNTKFETQRFQMEILNSQELSVKQKDNKNYIESLKERCKILKSKANTIHTIKNKIEVIDKILENKYNFSNIDDLEIIRKELEDISDLSIERGNNNPVKTNFKDSIEEVREHNSSDFVDKASIQTEIQKRLKEYLDNLVLIQQLEKSKLITSLDIENIKHYIFDIEKNIKDKLDETNDFQVLLEEIINSTDKQVANKILDNFISLGSYSQKQIELMVRIKNIVFEKQYINIGKAVSSVKDILGNDNHPLSSQFDGLSEKEQDDILNVVRFIEKLEVKVD